MEKITTCALAVLAAMCATTAQANQPRPWQAGFGLDLSLLAGYTQSHSQFNTDNTVTPDLASKGDKQSSVLIAPLGTISYTNEALNQQIYFGTSRSDLALGRFHVELGYKYRLADRSAITLSYVPGLLESETWQDPYVTDQVRQKTDSKIHGLRVQYDGIMGSPFSLELAAGSLDIDQEHSGSTRLTPEEQTLMQRDSNIYYSQLSYFKPLNRMQFLRFAGSYTRIDAKGDAMASDGIGVEVGLIQMLEQSSLALTFSYDRVDFDSQNPVFDRTQKDDRWGAFLAYEYKAPFEWKNWGFVSLLGYNQSQSNIRFYGEDSVLISVGMNYRF
ncbi:DUF2860 domain-containing protein [Photobacterium japonica]|uniref:DUF2860 domain-containing protein n=1 Tax=Photobacterium japonica TaxID=2910235 RepID=UPI003D1290F3